jgi:hypothetical protein
MDGKTKQIMEALKNNPSLVQSLFRTQDGQNLLQLLTQGDHGAELQQAAQSASHGDPSRMVQMISRIMQSPEGADLIQRIGKSMQK